MKGMLLPVALVLTRRLRNNVGFWQWILNSPVLGLFFPNKGVIKVVAHTQGIFFDRHCHGRSSDYGLDDLGL